MCVIIKMEDVVAGAFVTLIEKGVKRVTYDTIYRYGYKVEEIMRNNKVEAILLYSNVYAREFLRNYSSYFESFVDDKGNKYIQIKDNVKADDLRNNILAFVLPATYKTLMGSEAVSTII